MLAKDIEEIAAAEVAGLAGLEAGMLGSGAALGVIEDAMRTALRAAGARLLQAVLAGDDDGYAGPHARCASGHQAGYAGRPHATHIVDVWHAREHLADLADHLAFITPDPARWLDDRSDELDAGNIKAITQAARGYPLAGVKAEDLDKNSATSSATPTACAHFRKLAMFTGSGVIEGGCKAIVVQRTKQSGMHWTVSGAADIIALRCQHASGRWDELWPARRRPPGLRSAI